MPGSSATATPWHRRPIFLTLLASVALLLLASAVYTVSLQARRLSQAAQEAHGLNETLRITASVRNELALAENFRAIAQFGADTSAAQGVAINAAESGLANLRAALENSDIAQLDDVAASGLLFVDAAEAHIEASRNAQVGELSLDTQATLDRTFGAATRALDMERAASLDRMESVNETMNRVGSTAGFGVAFVVPAIALYVYEALRRTRLRVKQAEREVDQLRSNQHARATLDAGLLHTMSGIVRAVRHTEETGWSAGLVSQRMADLEVLVARQQDRALARGASITTQIEAFHPHAVIVEAARSAGVSSAVIQSALQDEHVLADPAHLHHALTELLRNASHHGGPDVTLTAYRWSNTVTLVVSDNGTGLPYKVEQALFRDDDIALRQNLANGELGSGLLAARSLTEAMGATLSYERSSNLTQLTVQLLVANVSVPSEPPSARIPS